MPDTDRTFAKKIALLGGAGPWASTYAHRLIVERAQWDYSAVEDHDYPSILHLSAPCEGFGALGIEDSKAVRAHLYGSFDLFRQWGAEIAIICCNSLHRALDNLVRDYPDIACVGLPEAGADAAAAHGLKKVAVICSESALQDNLHGKALTRHGIEAILPDRGQQDRINDIIHMVMAGDSTQKLYGEYRRLTGEFGRAGAQAIISGCTEISYLGNRAHSERPVIDCLSAAIDKGLRLAAK